MDTAAPEIAQLMGLSVKDSLPILIAIVSIFISAVAMYVSQRNAKKQHLENAYTYLADLWNDVLDTCLDHPDFLDLTKTENYHVLMSREEALKYDIYCYKAWGHVEDIIAKNFAQDAQFEPIIKWIACYHYTWLERNPTFFDLETFWQLIGKIRQEPNLVFGYRSLPSLNGDIDWNIVSENYHQLILGPYAPTMVAENEQGQRRNLLISHLSQENTAGKIIADFGCGPGNLVAHLPNDIAQYVGVDQSQKALDIAEIKARDRAIDAEFILQDLNQMALNEQFDIAVAVNSILPRKRKDVVRILTNIKSSLKPDGLLLCILPSFDTTLYLRDLWRAHYEKLYEGSAHAERIIGSFNKTKLIDETDLSYADDGANSQCYHSPKTITAEFAQAGLELVQPPEKIYYPWDLTRKFDYGFFPDAPEEIWDWFVIAKKAN